MLILLIMIIMQMTANATGWFSETTSELVWPLQKSNVFLHTCHDMTLSIDILVIRIHCYVFSCIKMVGRTLTPASCPGCFSCRKRKVAPAVSANASPLIIRYTVCTAMRVDHYIISSFSPLATPAADTLWLGFKDQHRACSLVVGHGLGSCSLQNLR